MSTDNFLPRVDIDPSVLYERLRSSSSHQRSEVSQILKDIDKDLEDYVSEISALTQRIAILRSRHERLQSHRLSLSTLLSPIHRLPNELLIRIFVFACEREEFDIESANKCTISVAAVCCRWRVLATRCSGLWSNIQLSLPAAAEMEVLLENYLELFLGRSKQHPLTLYLLIYGEPAEHPLLGNLLAHAPRWQCLCLETDLEPHQLPSLCNIPLPSLEIFNGDYDFLPLWKPLNNLRDISITTFLSIPSPCLLGSGITSLCFLPNLDNLFEPLNWFPNLVHLAIPGGLFRNRPLSGPPSRISITSLDIRFYQLDKSADDRYRSIDFLEVAMDFLTAPALSSLTITNLTSSNRDSAQTTIPHSFSRIRTFIGRSGCSLTVLEIKNIPIQDTCVVDLLRNLRFLVELSLTDPDDFGPWVNARRPTSEFPISKNFIESLHTHKQSLLRPSVNPLIPNLRYLVLVVRSKGFHHPSFISTISSRWIPDDAYAAKIGVACLRSVELHLLEPIEESDYLPLTPLENSGMRVVVL